MLSAALATAAQSQPASTPWFEPSDPGRPTAQARQALALLQSAAGHGLEPQDYQVQALERSLAEMQNGAEPAARESFAERLSAATTRYLQDLHQGRIDPRRIHYRFSPAERQPFDAAAYLQQALAASGLAAAATAAAPQLPLYGDLREALAQYRALGQQHPAWQRPLAPLPAAGKGGRKLEPGQPYADLDLLARRLMALGDLPASPAAAGTDAEPAQRYAEPLVGAVRAFQRRHGLGDDGLIGPATLAELQVAPAARRRQIELTMERLRWTPLQLAPRMITINIPEFVLRAYEVGPGPESAIRVREEMRVIVGKAFSSMRTPLFDETMRYIEFSPYWNVPPSIARGELVPRLRRDPSHFEQQGFEFVDSASGAVRAGGPSAATLDAVLAGQLRIRQRPGPRNALGDIKFAFPNSDHIYLHHTPSVDLFQRERRDFSHGCIRVENPLALARFVLQEQSGWDEPRIREAMSAGKSATLKLEAPMPVLIAYGTALVKQTAGPVYFFADIYGHDRVLDQALRQRSAALAKVGAAQ